MDTLSLKASFDQMLAKASFEMLRHVYDQESQEDSPSDLGTLTAQFEDYADFSSWVQLFSSTLGPFRGVGGAAMTNFRVSIVTSDGLTFVFVGEDLIRVLDAHHEATKALRAERRLPKLSSLDAAMLPWSPRRY